MIHGESDAATVLAGKVKRQSEAELVRVTLKMKARCAPARTAGIFNSIFALEQPVRLEIWSVRSQILEKLREGARLHQPDRVRNHSIYMIVIAELKPPAPERLRKRSRRERTEEILQSNVHMTLHHPAMAETKNVQSVAWTVIAANFCKMEEPFLLPSSHL
ncbi:hypothetical protein RB195_013923 [Necator americanus]|uniref:Uncharacterized protein n=1 Tax=Necator americanus TaxID=51031 RepID=A0ABR1DXS3_NECAM